MPLQARVELVDKSNCTEDIGTTERIRFGHAARRAHCALLWRSGPLDDNLRKLEHLLVCLMCTRRLQWAGCSELSTVPFAPLRTYTDLARYGSTHPIFGTIST